MGTFIVKVTPDNLKENFQVEIIYLLYVLFFVLLFEIISVRLLYEFSPCGGNDRFIEHANLQHFKA
jgi:hypothetical protein